MFVDSHCHLDRLSDKTHGGDVAATLDAAREAHVTQFLAVAVSLDDMPALAALSQEHDDVVISAGLHPLHTPALEPDANAIMDAATQHGAIAIGETGLDYHYDESVPADVQYARFEQHLIAARKLELPVIVHTREAREDTLALLEKHIDPRVGGVLHCFTEDIDMARRAVGLGFYISLSGIVTFASATALRELAGKLPLDRMLIETDSPYLAPVPHRGKPNEPAFVVNVAECIAAERGISVDELAMQTTANFYHLFRAAAPETTAQMRESLTRAGLV